MQKFDILGRILARVHKEWERPFGEGVSIERSTIPEEIRINPSEEQAFTIHMFDTYHLITAFSPDHDMMICSEEEFKANGGFMLTGDELQELIEENGNDMEKMAKALQEKGRRQAN